MLYHIDAVESSMLDRIVAARLHYLRFAGSYGGELMGDWQAVIRALPAVWVAFQGMTEPKPCNTAQTRFEARVQFSTVVASRSLRSEATARKGGRRARRMWAPIRCLRMWGTSSACGISAWTAWTICALAASARCLQLK